MDVEIMCIKKSTRMSPHERIHSIGGINPNGSRWYLSIDDAIAGIEAGKWSFYTTGGVKPVVVKIATHEGHKYLKTEADGIHPNNLLSLRECPL